MERKMQVRNSQACPFPEISAVTQGDGQRQTAELPPDPTSGRFWEGRAPQVQVPDGERLLEPVPPIAVGALWLLSCSVPLSPACLHGKLHPDPESPASGKKKKRERFF